MNHPMLKNKFCYTYQEIFDAINDYGLYAPEMPHDKNEVSSWFKDLLGDLDLVYYYQELDIGTGKITESELQDIVQLLMNIIYERHYKDYIYIVKTYEDSYVITLDDIKEAIGKILNVLDLTLPKYIPMFIQFKKYSPNPVAQLESRSEGDSRFNDTPQNGGNFHDDNHATNTSHSESKSYVDSDSIVNRLNNLFKNWRSIMLEWSNDFNQLFFKEEQL